MDEEHELVNGRAGLRYRLLSAILRPIFGAANFVINRVVFQSDELEISRWELCLPRLAPEFDGYRLVHLSDIHLGTWIDEIRLEDIVARINRQQPDLVLITGDFVSDAEEGYLAALVRSLGRLNAPDGIVGVLGNHDHWAGAEAVRRALRLGGITDVGNDVTTVRRGSAELHLAGVEAVYDGGDRLDLVLERLPPDGAAILLCHEPDFADNSAHTGRFDLQLSGHSHGGQLVFPIIGAPVLPRYARKYPQGMYRIDGMVQYTSRGVGTSRLQLRLNAPPELAVFTLRAPGKAGALS